MKYAPELCPRTNLVIFSVLYASTVAHGHTLSPADDKTIVAFTSFYTRSAAVLWCKRVNAGCWTSTGAWIVMTVGRAYNS